MPIAYQLIVNGTAIHNLPTFREANEQARQTKLADRRLKVLVQRVEVDTRTAYGDATDYELQQEAQRWAMVLDGPAPDVDASDREQARRELEAIEGEIAHRLQYEDAYEGRLQLADEQRYPV